MNLALLMSRLSTAARFGAGRTVSERLGARPAQALILYEYESCPYCRRVREAITDLDLEVEIRPCPRDGARFRPGVKERAARATFPFLIDPNHDLEMFDSVPIVEHLYARYGTGRAPAALTSPFFIVSSQIASLLRGVAGTWRRASYVPEQPLELDGFEGDPDARLVRERLCELELPYIRRNGAVVRFVDPSTSTTLEGSPAILAYLSESWSTTPVKRLAA